MQSLRILLHAVYNAKKKSWGQNFKRLWIAADICQSFENMFAGWRNQLAQYTTDVEMEDYEVIRRHESPVRRGIFVPDLGVTQ